MSRATPQMRNFAVRLMACETRRGTSSETTNQVGFRVCEKLRPPLATLAGNAGFRALLARALALATVDAHWLGTLHVKLDGSLEGSGELAMRVDRQEIAAGGAVLLAQLLGLLVAFIGEKLTLQIAREVWPKLPVDDLDESKCAAAITARTFVNTSSRIKAW